MAGDTLPHSKHTGDAGILNGFSMLECVGLYAHA